MIIKCKICGGDISFNPGDTYGTCDHCGNTSTIPKADDEQKLNRYNRANHFRRQSEFDKAIAAYDRILEEDDTDAEAHWGAALSRYGIEYVEDPATGRHVPTCHRVQVESILADADYLAALEHAPDEESRKLYEQQAKEIAEIQKGILAISANEKPYDIFICYKETDENGQRTRDSALAQEVYYGLTEQGYKVFFSRITLEDKLGQQYEPYIFAALNSAKVMVVIGTRPEHFNAVWVKNEWSRYLHLMKSDRKRLLIPCYRDMDPYDLPDELSSLQSQDMSKIGFMQDLIRGIRKVLSVGLEKIAVPVQPVVQQVVKENSNVTALLDRAYLALEDGEFARADEFCEQALNLDAKNVRAYIGKLMVERKTQKPDDLMKQSTPLTESNHYQKAIRFSNEEQKIELEKWNQSVFDQIETNRKLKIVSDSISRLKKDLKLEEYESVRKSIKTIIEFQGAQEALIDCEQRELKLCEKLVNEAQTIEECETVKDKIYMLAELDGIQDIFRLCEQQEDKLNNQYYQRGIKLKTNRQWNRAINEFLMCSEHYLDSAAQINECKELKQKDLVMKQTIQNLEEQYSKEVMDYDRSKSEIDKAKKELDEVEKQQEWIQKQITEKQNELSMLKGLFSGKKRAIVEKVLSDRNEELEKQKRLVEKAQERYQRTINSGVTNPPDQQKHIYEIAMIYYENGAFPDAYYELSRINEYKDVVSILNSDENLIAVATAAAAREEKLAQFKTVGNVVKFGMYEQDNTSNGKEEIEWLVLDVQEGKALLLSKYGLDAKPYNTKYTDITWEKCTLRKWLNGDFVNTAFSREEKAAILTTAVDNSSSQGYSKRSTNGGNNTQDQIFLLRYAEANKYLDVTYDNSKNLKSRVSPTAYAKAQGASTSDRNKTEEGNAAGWWWLRSPGHSQSYAASVNDDGSLIDGSVSSDSAVVRPAFWLDLESDIF